METVTAAVEYLEGINLASITMRIVMSMVCGGVIGIETVSYTHLNLGRNGMEERREGFGVFSVFGQRLHQRLVMVGSQVSSRCGVDRDSVPVQ